MVKAGKLQITTRQTGSLHMFAVTSGGWSLVQQLSKRAFLLTLSSTPPVAVLRGDSRVSGTVTFEQSSEFSPTTITYDITGNDPNAERGMHVHQFGDNTNGCTSAGPHCTSSLQFPRRNGKDYLVLVDTDLLRRRKSTHMARHTVPHPMRSAMLETWATSRLMRKGMARESLLTRKSN